MTTKRCFECEQDKPSDMFYKSRFAKDGLSLLCGYCLHKNGKLCSGCGKHKSIQEFPADKENFISYCQECINTKDPPDLSKWCSSCGKEKPQKDFRKNKRNEDGLASHCKQCRSFLRKRKKKCSGCRKEFLQDRSSKDDLTSYCLECTRKHNSNKRCSSCGKEKSRKDFHREGHNKDGLYSRCKKCRYAYRHSKKCL